MTASLNRPGGRPLVWSVFGHVLPHGAQSFGDGVAIAVELGYDRRDPLAVSAVLSGTQWFFDRDTLQHAVLGDVINYGGDVTICPRRNGWIQFDLCSPDGEASVWIDSSILREFLFASSVLVPFGAESDYLDWDSAFTIWFGGAA